MAKLSLKCECGWSFFIPDSTQGYRVTCPNCTAPVRIPGRSPERDGRRMSAGEIAARKNQQNRTTRLLVGAVVGIVFLGIILVWQMSGKTEAPAPAPGTPEAPAPIAGPKPTPPPPLPPLPGPSAFRPLDPDPDPAKLIDAPTITNRIRSRIREANMKGIVAETLRLKHLPQAQHHLLEEMRENEAEIVRLLDLLERAGVAISVQDRIKPGDRILSMNLKPVDGVPVEAGRVVLLEWLRRFQPRPESDEVRILREGREEALYIGFTDASKDLIQLVRLPDTLKDGAPPPPRPDERVKRVDDVQARPVVLPEDVLLDVEDRFKMLPAGYRTLLTAADRVRLARILKAKKGMPVDLMFLRVLRNRTLPVFEKEAREFRSKARELETKVLREAPAVDRLLCKDGRKLEGTILEETETHVKLKMAFGSVTLPKSDVRRIERGKGEGKEFQARYKKAGKNVKALDALLSWCEDKKLSAERRFVSYVILTLDPANDRAREVVGRRRQG